MKNKPLTLQIIWAVLSCLWNIIGVWLLSQGKQALGPTASWTTVAIILVVVLLLLLSLQKEWHKMYLALCGLIMLAVAAPIYNALTGDAALWPSSFVRVLGLAINVCGLIGSIMGVKMVLFSKNK